MQTSMTDGGTLAGPVLRLGLPVWARRDWIGRLYRSSRSDELLSQYASVFGAVEGNSSFYAVPSEASVRRWAEQTPVDFRFCFKLPRSVTHDRSLLACSAEARHFLTLMAPLGPRLGPFMIQLPSSFGPARLRDLEWFLDQLPGEHEYAIELRHPSFFDRGPHARALRAALRTRGCHRVVLDTRGVRAGAQDHPDLLSARHPKPDLPLDLEDPGSRPIIRFIGHPELSPNDDALQAWSEVLAGWAAEGRRPYFFVHCPNDLWAPDLARRAHGILRTRLPLEAMPAWPGQNTRPAAQQLSLF